MILLPVPPGWQEVGWGVGRCLGCSPVAGWVKQEAPGIRKTFSFWSKSGGGPQAWSVGWSTCPVMTGLRGLELYSLGKRRLWGDHRAAFQDLKGSQESWRGTLYKGI